MYSHRISINTTPSGANIDKTVLNYPLLVKLNDSNFDFKKTNADGSDIRFSKSDRMTALEYEIARWDIQTLQAEIWVLADSVLGNNDTQHIFMYSGNTNVKSLSNPARTFDTSFGYAGVWHLEDKLKINGNEKHIKDATSHANHGAPNGEMDESSSINAVVGKGLLFDGVDDFIGMEDPPALKLSGPVTVSAKLRADSNSHMAFLGKYRPEGEQRSWQVALEERDGVNRFQLFFSPNGQSGSTLHFASPKVIELEKWYDFTFVFVPSQSVSVYIDGGLDTTVADSVLPELFDSKAQFRIGARDGVFDAPEQPVSHSAIPLKGAVDEVRISRVNRSAEWVRLNYESQKKDSRVVTVEKPDTVF
jgi:biopolymer transport protein ExbB